MSRARRNLDIPPGDRRRDAGGAWHLDKRISITLIIGVIVSLLFNGGTAIWSAASFNALVDADRKELALHQQRLDDQEKMILGQNGLFEKMTRLEEKAGTVQKSVDRIENKIDVPPIVERPHR